MKPIIIFSILCLSLFSCTKKGPVYFNPAAASPCNIYEDSASISNKIIGSWKLSSSTCWSSGESPADKKVQVNFISNGTFNVLEKTVVVTQGNWKLKTVVASQWQLDLSVPNSYLNGFILFCNNRVTFADAYSDGCNSFFDRVN